ncbi:MAG: hypothetical protein JWO67_1729 [Streptosporangiaceae bacterium]|nr:hypothetical protein [Streptosporangiaceae bacterium]
MAEHHELRWGGVAGFGYALLALIAYFLPGGAMPRVDATAGQIVTFFSENRALVITQAFLLGGAAALLVWFGAALAQTLRERAADSDLPGALLGGVILVAAVMFVGAALYGSIAYRTGELATMITMVGLYDVTQVLFTMIGIAAAVPFVALAMGIHRTHMLPDWMMWFAIACAVLGVASALFVSRTGGTFRPGGPVISLIPFLAYVIFVIVASALMVREHLPAMVAKPRAMGHT